jgi:hypothetical protein
MPWHCRAASSAGTPRISPTSRRCGRRWPSVDDRLVVARRVRRSYVAVTSSRVARLATRDRTPHAAPIRRRRLRRGARHTVEPRGRPLGRRSVPLGERARSNRRDRLRLRPAPPGLATEASRALVEWAFTTAGMHRVIGRTGARNAASARVLEKLGMRLEAHFVENEWVKGEWQSELVYAVLDREWPASSSDRR